MDTEAVSNTEIESPAVEAEATTDAGIEAEAPEAPVEEPTSDEPRFTVKVDGVEEAVTLDELLNGYSRQADYTRKTQEIAAERQRLQQYDALAYALQSDPQGTLAQLARELGVPIGDNSSQEVDPQEQRLQSIEQMLVSEQQRRQQEQANAQAQAQIDHELRTLHSQVGDFSDESLIQYAVERQIPVLSEAFKAMKYEEYEAQKRAEHNRTVAAKRQDAVVEGGASKTQGAVVPGGSDRPSVREAYQAAVAALSK